jgi:uncharacterized repeat protein (TIGR01451 family)
VGYTFALVAEAGVPPIRGLAGVPALNNDGLVAFRAVFVDDSLPAIMTATAGGPPTTLTTSADEDFSSFGDPVIADSGVVAFRAFLSGGGSAIYQAGGGGPLDPVQRPDAVYGGFGDPSVSRGGRLSFRASLFDGEEEAIVGGFLSGGGLFTITSDADGFFAGYGQNTATGDLDSQVAFVASESTGGSGVYLSNMDGDGGVITQIVDGNQFDALNQYVSIDNQGRVAFLGFPVGGGAGIFVGRNGSALTTIATTGDVFDEFGVEDGDGTPSINDAGVVAFYARLVGGGAGIFTGPDPVLHKVIRLGDPLLDSTVVQLVFGGMNNAGQIVFLADLADERRVIVLATPGDGAAPGGADLAVSIGASPANPGVGSTVTVTSAATNLGPAVATGVQVGSLLPAGLAIRSAAPSQGRPGVGGIATSPLVFTGDQSVATTEFNPAVALASVSAEASRWWSRQNGRRRPWGRTS